MPPRGCSRRAREPGRVRALASRAPSSRAASSAEAHLGRSALLAVEPEEIAAPEPEGPREQIARKGLTGGVEVAHDGVVVPARVLDGVLELRELSLQRDKVLVGAQLRVRFGDRKQRRDGA